MSSKIIYEKKYQHCFQEIEKEIAKSTTDKSIPTHHIDANDFIKKTFEKAVFVLIPERVEKVPIFIALAIQNGERWMADTTIIEYEDRISVTYAMQKEEPYDGMGELATMADEMRLNSNEINICISFDYYTYATYQDGKRIFPSAI